MSDIIKRQVPVLALNGKNYQTWALHCELHSARPNDAVVPHASLWPRAIAAASCSRLLLFWLQK